MDRIFARVCRLDSGQYKRVIAISDIHGDYDGFLGVLQQVHFSDEDALVIIGDIIEKGAYSLKLLRKIMEYARKGNVYPVIGNNDIILEEWLGGRIEDVDIMWYMNAMENSIIIDMAQELHMDYHTIEDIGILKETIKEIYSEEIAFLCETPHIIESEEAIFVHAGIKPGDVHNQDLKYCICAPAFGREKYRFEKKVFVGHWPTSNYCDEIINTGIYINKETNVISLDGGNSMKKWQQINYIILEKGQMSSGYFEDLPKIKVLEDQEETENPATLVFPNTYVEIIERYTSDSICYIPYLDKRITLKNDHIYKYKGKNYSWDFTTYNLGVKEGEVLSYCGTSQNGILVKRDGVVGNYRGRYQMVRD